MQHPKFDDMVHPPLVGGVGGRVDGGRVVGRGDGSGGVGAGCGSGVVGAVVRVVAVVVVVAGGGGDVECSNLDRQIIWLVCGQWSICQM